MSTSNVTREPRQIPPFMNKIMALMLRSPLHGTVSKHILLLTFKGRKSGKTYTIPVGYMRQGNKVTLLTDHNWWKNLRGGAPVTLRIQGKTYQGTAQALPDDKELTVSEMQAFVKNSPMSARAYDIQVDANGEPDLASVQSAAQRFTLIQVQLT
jgi:deazaflavin-dependent oxidoreductase (nitroreductase family)